MTEHHWHYADETDRRKWQDPEGILREIGVKPGLTFIDLGCGEGFFTLPAARMIGPAGKVYGVDSDEQAVARLRRRAELEKLANIELTVGPAETALLCRGCADIVFFGIVLHDFEKPALVLRNAHLMLKPDGRLVNLDWQKISMAFGPPVAKRFSPETAAQLIASAGFKVLITRASGQYFYLMIAGPASV